MKNAELSRIVLAEFIQLAPDRMVWIARDSEDARRLAVTVSGTGYRGNASFPCASQIEVRLERFLDADEGDIGWVPATASPATLFDTEAIAGQTVWTGTVELPPDGEDARFRLVVQEFEYFLGDIPELLGTPLGRGRDRRL